MAVLRTAVSELAFYDPDSEKYDLDALQRKAIRLTGQVTTICAAWARIRKGQEPVAPRKDLTLAAEFRLHADRQRAGKDRRSMRLTPTWCC